MRDNSSNNDNTDNTEVFDPTVQIESPIHSFKIVHLYNKSDTYHLTRQVLVDSMLTQNTYCFFYHILSKNIDDFNQMYGSFACLISRSPIEADLYLNVDSDALKHIVGYIQTTKIDSKAIYNQSWRTVDEIIGLAVMFGMPELVSMMRQIQPSDTQIDAFIADIKFKSKFIFKLLCQYFGCTDDDNSSQTFMEAFIDENKDDIINLAYKKSLYKSDFYTKLLQLIATQCLAQFCKLYDTNNTNIQDLTINPDTLANLL